MRDTDLDEAKEDGLYRGQRAYERAVTRRDPFYPPELHEQDVRGRFGLDQFRWREPGADKAVAAIVHRLKRNRDREIDIVKAIEQVIPNYSYNHENIPIWEIDNIKKLVEQQFEEKGDEDAVHSTSGQAR